MASLLVLSEASSSFLTCFTRLTHPSTVPALAHPQVGVSTVRSSSVAFLSFHFPLYWHFHFSVCFRFVCCRPSSPFTNFKPHSSHLTLGHLQRHCYLEQQQFHRSLLPHLLSVYLPRFERGFTVGLQPSRVTGLQATSPERSPPSAPLPLCLAVSRHDIFCSGVTGPLASSPVASPLDLNRFSVFQKGGSRGKSRSIADSLHP